MKLENQHTPYTKINSRWIKDLNINPDTIKVLEENIGRKISDIPCTNIFTDISPKARDIKERINKWNRIDIPEIKLHLYGQLIFDNGGSSINGVKIASSTNGVARAG